MEISFGLSVDSVQNAIDQLEEYKKGLQRKCNELCKQLSEYGEGIAQMCIGMSPLGPTITLQSEITEEEAGCKAILTAVGQTSQTQDYPPFNTLLAVEFGAGISYNSTNTNPLADEFNMGVGKFPGQTHAFQKVWWYYGNDNKWHKASGVEATMPMYNAASQMEERLSQVAKEVFGRD